MQPPEIRYNRYEQTVAVRWADGDYWYVFEPDRLIHTPDGSSSAPTGTRRSRMARTDGSIPLSITGPMFGCGRTRSVGSCLRCSGFWMGRNGIRGADSPEHRAVSLAFNPGRILPRTRIAFANPRARSASKAISTGPAALCTCPPAADCSAPTRRGGDA